MLRDYVSIGNKLELIKMNNKVNGEIKTYTSKLLDFVDEDKAYVAMPIERGRVIPLSVGERYYICFYTDKGLFQCKAVITSRFKNENIFTLEVQFISELEKYQRREFYRMECNMDIMYHIITDAEKLLSNKLERNKYENEEQKNKALEDLEALKNVWQEGSIIDISGGGLRFNSNSETNPDDMGFVSMDLLTSEGMKNLMLYIRVISCVRLVNHWGYYEHRIQFKDITRDERELIVKYIFEEDRKRRRREKGLD